MARLGKRPDIRSSAAGVYKSGNNVPKVRARKAGALPSGRKRRPGIARGRAAAPASRLRRRLRPARPVAAAGGAAAERAWRLWGMKAGERDAAKFSIANEGYQKKALNRCWLRTMEERSWSRVPWKYYAAAAQGYVKGYGQASGIDTNGWMLLPTDKSVAVIMCVMNEEATVTGVLEQLHRLPIEELVVVVNGSSDQSFQTLRKQSHALIVNYPHALGYDTGRAIGAKLAQSDILLFVDGDFSVQAEDLVPFIAAVDRGTDLALNQLTPYLGTFQEWDSVSMVKQFLNAAMGRPDLQANSMTAVPHAMSRRAITTIGTECLAVPPKAQALAMLHGLSVSAPWSVDVITRNKAKQHNVGERNPVSEMIVGDHVEALSKAMELAGERLSFPDTIRKRDYL